MPSPFPGMNPYLEHPDIWPGVHYLLIAGMVRSVVAQCPKQYEVRPEKELYIREASADERRRMVYRADVGVSGPRVPAGAPAGAVAEAPTYATFEQSVTTDVHRWLEVRDLDTSEIITVIELLSPANKVASRGAYLEKRRRLLYDRVNFVEIDLLRLAGRMPLDGLPPCDYCLAVARPEERPRVGVWPLMLRDPLPVLPVPLRPPDADVYLDLPTLLDDAYDGGGFARSAYRHPPDPPLPEADSAWAESVLATA